MKVDKHLNLVVPLEQESGGTIYVHATPISREVFERYFLVISKTFAAIYQHGLNEIAGPRVGSMMLKRIAQDAGVWEGEDGVENGLLKEIRRLTNVIAPGPKGWSTYPLEDALRDGLVDPEDSAEAENSIVFFTVGSLMHRRADRLVFLSGAARLWGWQLTSSNCTAFSASLPTSTATENTGETVSVVTSVKS